MLSSLRLPPWVGIEGLLVFVSFQSMPPAGQTLVDRQTSAGNLVWGSLRQEGSPAEPA